MNAPQAEFSFAGLKDQLFADGCGAGEGRPRRDDTGARYIETAVNCETKGATDRRWLPGTALCNDVFLKRFKPDSNCRRNRENRDTGERRRRQ